MIQLLPIKTQQLPSQNLAKLKQENVSMESFKEQQLSRLVQNYQQNDVWDLMENFGDTE
jgi:hypothetical protein